MRHKKILGFTLLEIMLVLAVGSMIAVMAIRYYTAANAGRSADTTLSKIQAIITAVDDVTQSQGTYTSLQNSTISSVLPATGLTSDWGSAITVAGLTSTIYTITIAKVPPSVCPILDTKLLADQHFTLSSGGACSGTAADRVYQFNATP